MTFNDPSNTAHTDHSAAGEETSWPKSSVSAGNWETSFQHIDKIALQDLSRARFAKLLRETWPATSDAETSRKAARALGVSAKTVKNWLACTHSPPFEIVFAIACFTGVYRTMDVMTRGEGRNTILQMFTRGVRNVVGK